MLLIDADITCFSSCASANEEIEWDEDTWSYYFDFDKGKRRFQDWLDKTISQTGMSEFKLCFTGKDNFRKKLNPSYKGNRGKKPVGYGALKEWAKETYPFFEKDQLEADDAMGILATKFPGRAFPLTLDKDLLTIPGRMFHLNQKLEGQWVDSNEKDGNRQFLMQALMGDPVDGYSGCPGVGKVTAAKLLDKHGEVWATVEQAYVKAGLTKEDALLNARMARILRTEDWDEDKQEVRLWTPPA
jgi:DNA polymerase-1